MYKIRVIEQFVNFNEVAENLCRLLIKGLTGFSNARDFIIGKTFVDVNRVDLQKIVDKFGTKNFDITDEFGIHYSVSRQVQKSPDDNDYFLVNVINSPFSFVEYIRNIRLLMLPDLSAFADVKKFVCEGAVYKVNSQAVVQLSHIMGQANLKVVPVSKEQRDAISKVGENLGRFQIALDWYKNLGTEEKKNADFVIEFYSKLINNVDVTEMTKQ